MTTPLHAPSVLLAPPAQLVLRPFVETDRADVVGLLSILPVLYPNGRRWLERRLSELSDEGPRCTVACLNGEIAGVAIETPKMSDVVKLSTLYVDPGARGRGVGSSIADFLVKRWQTEERRRAYVTAAHTVAPDVLQCLDDVGFLPIAAVPDRYGPNRHEVILEWLSNRGPVSS